MSQDIEDRYSFSGWKNNSSETCPAYGVARVTDVTVLANKLTQVQATKPDTTFARTYIVNGPKPVPAGKPGRYFTSREVIVLCDAAAAFDEGWGPKNGQWSLSKNYPMSASIVGEHSSSKKYYRARWGEINQLIGKIDGAYNSAGNDVKIYSGAAGSEAVITSWTVAGKYWQDTRSVDTDGKVHVVFENNTWYIKPVGRRIVIGKLDAAFSTGSNTVSVWGGTAGSESDTGVNITARPWADVTTTMFPMAATNAKVICEETNDGWYFSPVMDLTQAAGYSGSSRQYFIHTTSAVATWVTAGAC